MFIRQHLATLVQKTHNKRSKTKNILTFLKHRVFLNPERNITNTNVQFCLTCSHWSNITTEWSDYHCIAHTQVNKLTANVWYIYDMIMDNVH